MDLPRRVQCVGNHWRGSSNVAPTVSAGANQTITLPNGTNLSGTVTDDGLPNPPQTVTTTWSKVSGPGNVQFGEIRSKTNASFSKPGLYTLRLRANDGNLEGSDEVTIRAGVAD